MPIFPSTLQVNTAIYISTSIPPFISPSPEIALVSLPDKLNDLINLIMHTMHKSRQTIAKLLLYLLVIMNYLHSSQQQQQSQ